MKIKRGIPVSAGVAIGQAVVLDTEDFRIATHHIEPNQVETEVQRLRTALAAAAREARETQENIAAKVGQQIGDILGAHAQLLESAPLARDAEQLIRQQLLASESAFSRIIARYTRALSGLGPNNPFASRSADLLDIEKRVLAQLLGQRREELRQHPGPLVVLAHDLTPSETAGLDPHHVHAFVTEAGAKTSHTAIMAGALEIPAIVGLGPFLDEVNEGSTVIVDGHDGVLIQIGRASCRER